MANNLDWICLLCYENNLIKNKACQKCGNTIIKIKEVIVADKKIDFTELKKLLIRHEAMRLFPYRCSAGKLTIGVGRNIEETGITKDEANYLLETDVNRVWKELNKHLPFFENLSGTRQTVLMDMCFNLGISRFLKFKKMIAALENEDFTKAASEMADSNWANQVGQRAKRLIQFMVKDEIEY